MAAPRVSQMGGGIAREDIGASTRTYVDYFEGDNAAGKDAGTRKANYSDVVNKCVSAQRAVVSTCGPSKRLLACYHAPRTRTRRSLCLACARQARQLRARQLQAAGAAPLARAAFRLPRFLWPQRAAADARRYYDLATSFYEYGWCV